MFRSFVVFYICCVGLSVAQEFPQVEDSEYVLQPDIEEPEVVNDDNCTVSEQWSDCANANCRAEYCSQKGFPVACATVPYCEPGCLCIDGYLRDESGLCVPEEDCNTNTTCPLYEQWSDCANGFCRAKHCSESGLPVHCSTISECVPGCLCIDGYLRDESGLCVPEADCSNNKCPVHEQWSDCANGICRANFCTQRGLPVPCPSVSECVPGCLCEYKYLRDESGLCVPEEDCTAKPTCPLHEQWSDCANAECRAEYCTQRGSFKRCPIVYECEPRCLCQDNYFRDESGICVPEKDCPNDCGPNEVFECVNPCPRIETCEERALNITCSWNQQCDYLCVCKEGYFRRFEGGECIPEIECGPRACGDNERYTHCKPSCSNDTCSSLASLRSCENQEPCKAGCTCRDGYYREEEGSPCKPLCLCAEAQETHDCSAWSTQHKQEKSRREGIQKREEEKRKEFD